MHNLKPEDMSDTPLDVEETKNNITLMAEKMKNLLAARPVPKAILRFERKLEEAVMRMARLGAVEEEPEGLSLADELEIDGELNLAEKAQQKRKDCDNRDEISLSLEKNCEICDNGDSEDKERDENTNELNVRTNMSVGELSVTELSMAAGGALTASENMSVGELRYVIGGEVTAGANMSVGELSVAVRDGVTTRENTSVGELRLVASENMSAGENISELNMRKNMSVGELSVTELSLAAGIEVTASVNMSVGELRYVIGGGVTAGAEEEVTARENPSVGELSLATNETMSVGEMILTKATKNVNVSTMLRVENGDMNAEMSMSLEKTSDIDRREIAAVKTSEVIVIKLMRDESRDARAEMDLSLEKECEQECDNEWNVKGTRRVDQLSEYPTEDKLSLVEEITCRESEKT